MNAERGYPWIKLPTKLPFDIRYSRLSDSAKATYIELYCLAGQADAGGLLTSAGAGYSLTKEDIAYTLHRDTKEIAEIFKELTQAGFIREADDGWEIPQFLDEQGTKYADKREAWKIRQAKRREQIKKEELRKEDKEIDKDKDKEVTRESRVTTTPGSSPMTTEESNQNAPIPLENYSISRDEIKSWNMALGDLQRDIPKAFFDSYITCLELVDVKDSTFVVQAINKYAADLVTTRYGQTIKDYLKGYLGKPAQIEIVV